MQQETSELAGRMARQFGPGRLYELLQVVASADVGPFDDRALVAYASRKLRTARMLYQTIGLREDEPELYNQIAFLWLEVRCEWCRHNQVVQYQMRDLGEPDLVLVTQASVAAAMVAWLESLLHDSDVTTLMGLAADPLVDAIPTAEAPPGAVEGPDPSAEVHQDVVAWVIGARIREHAPGGRVCLGALDAGALALSIRSLSALEEAVSGLVRWLHRSVPDGAVATIRLAWQDDEHGPTVTASSDTHPDEPDAPSGWESKGPGAWAWSAAVMAPVP